MVDQKSHVCVAIKDVAELIRLLTHPGRSDFPILDKIVVTEANIDDKGELLNMDDLSYPIAVVINLVELDNYTLTSTRTMWT